jgi:hypothetical protein
LMPGELFIYFIRVPLERTRISMVIGAVRKAYQTAN